MIICNITPAVPGVKETKCIHCTNAEYILLISGLKKLNEAVKDIKDDKDILLPMKVKINNMLKKMEDMK